LRLPRPEAPAASEVGGWGTRRAPVGRRAPWWGLTLILCALGAREARAQSFPSELRVIADVRLVGRHQVPARDIRAVLKTRGPSIWPWRERPALRLDFLRADTLAIETVCRQYGFLDARARARVTSTRNPREAIVEFVIEEGRRSRVSQVSFTGLHAYPAEQLRKRLTARPGKPYNPSYVIVDTLRISRAYQERGYIPHVAAAVARDSLRVSVRYDVTEGPLFRFGDVLVLSPSDNRVREPLVRRELLIRRGEVYRYQRLERSIERLYETGLFSQVQMTPMIDSTRSLIDVDLLVRPRKPRWIDAGVGSGTAERLRSTGEWGHRNLGGRALQGVLATKLAFDDRARFLLTRTEVSLLEPWLLRTRTRGEASGYFERGDDRTDHRWTIREETRGFSFQLRREIGRYTRVSLTDDNAFVLQWIDWRDPAVTPLVQDSLSRNVPPRFTTHRLQLGFDRDRRDNPLSPTNGSYQNLALEVAGGPLKGTSSFTKGQAITSWYTPLSNGWVLASRVRAGVIRPFGNEVQFSPDPTLDREVQRVPLLDRFRTGGVNSIRGYSENSIPASGGLALLEGSLELRLPLIGPFGLEVFADAGNVWLRPSLVTARGFTPRLDHESLRPEEVHYVFGVGPRLNLPVGPLRLDFTWSLRPTADRAALVAEPQFAIGPAF
jgi:outer membrane protein insertion porin family